MDFGLEGRVALGTGGSGELSSKLWPRRVCHSFERSLSTRCRFFVPFYKFASIQSALVEE